jgi:hypothetical protein
MSVPFYFMTRLNLVRLLGASARDPRELLEHIRKVPTSSIYYHTHRFVQEHHYLSPQPPNDFAYWLNNILNVKALGEAFESVNIVEFGDLEEVRAKFVQILKRYLSGRKRVQRCPEGMEFHFMSCKTFVMPTRYVAQDLAEFVETVKKISVNSLYFHFFEARMRLGRDENDFSSWLKVLGLNDEASRLSSLDPYTMTLENLRKKIVEVLDNHAAHT